MEVMEPVDLSLDEDEFLDRLISSTEFMMFNTMENFGNNDGLRNTSDIISNAIVNRSTSSPEVSSNKPLARSSAKKRKITENLSLPPDDIRSTYARDYINALNSADEAILMGVLRTIAIPKVVLAIRTNKTSSELAGPSNIEVVGIEAIAKVMESYFTAIPDMVCKILSEKSRLYENEESCIGCIMQTNGSKMYEIEGLPEGVQEKVVLKANSDPINAEIISNIEDSVHNTVKVPLKLGVQQKRKDFSYRYTLTMHLNVNKKVFLIMLVTE